MAEQIEKKNNFVSVREAAQAVGYSHDYVTRLAREQKISARKEGRKWMIDVSDLQKFADDADQRWKEHKEKLSKERKVEHNLHRGQEAKTSVVRVVHAPNVGRVRALAQAMVVMVFGLTVGAYAYYSPSPQQIAAVGSSLSPTFDTAIFERTAVAFYRFISPEASYVAVDTTETGDGVQKRRAYNLVLNEGRALAEDIVADAFSDEVGVLFETETFDGGVVTPRFESGDGDAYRFKILLEELKKADVPPQQGG